jgi:hypothetical protein
MFDVRRVRHQHEPRHAGFDHEPIISLTDDHEPLAHAINRLDPATDQSPADRG